MEQQLISTVAAETLEVSRKVFPGTALAFVTREVLARAEAWGLICIAVDLRESGSDLVAVADFDLSDDDGKPYRAVFRTSMRTLH